MAGKIAGIAQQKFHFEPQLLSPRSNNFYLTRVGQLFVWGDNEFGKLGLGHTVDCLTPTLFKLPKNEKIYFIECGFEHYVCLTSNGLCYIWGKNSYGQLATGNTMDCFIPTLLTLPNNAKITYITCGESYTFCFTENNLYYVWGWNDFGQLGLGDKTNRLTPTLFSLPKKEKISFITSGSNYLCCLTENNLCYVWGDNYYGQLGLGDKIDRLSPTLLSLPSNERISFLTCGESHTVCLTENDSYFLWGDNVFGQLGFDDIGEHSTPISFNLPNNERISFITCGFNFTICLTENKLCYVWGDNAYGQLGLGDTTNHSTPTLLTLPNNEKISFITCGQTHTICLTENNLCYGWGDNEFGQLGIGHNHDCLTPTQIYLPRNE